MSNLDKLILNEGYDCNASITIGDTVPTITSMVEKGEPDIAPEGWIDLLPDVVKRGLKSGMIVKAANSLPDGGVQGWRSEEHTSELQSLMRFSYAVFCLKKKRQHIYEQQS